MVKEVLADEEKECDSVVVPIQQEMNDVDKRRNELKDKQKGKKDEEISTAEKDEVNASLYHHLKDHFPE
jgi:molecular chaperone HtpG